MKQRVLLAGEISQVEYPDKGTFVPAENQPSPEDWPSPPAGISYVAPSKSYAKAKLHFDAGLPGQKWLVSVPVKGRFSKVCRPVMLLEKAPYEIEARCPCNGICGGCCYQTVPYEKQLALKDNQVRQLLSALPQAEEVISRGDFLPIQASPLQYGFRNKMEFSFGDSEKGGPLTLGMHKRGAWHDIISASNCELSSPEVRELVKATETYFRSSPMTYYSTYRHDGQLRHLSVRQSFADGSILLNLDTVPEVADEELLGWKDAILSLPEAAKVSGILHTFNSCVADVVRPDQVHVLYGKDYLTEELLGLRFRISPFSFFQTNSGAAEVLYSFVRQLSGDLSSGTAFDLYCGTGTIAQILASGGAKEVIGIEIVEEAVEAARENARQNHLANCRFLAGDVLKLVETLKMEPDLIVLDPPRSGIHPKAMPKILACHPERFIYVSCKPTSLVRDLPYFLEAGYKIRKIGCVDLFPQTINVETVCLLSRTESS